MGPKKSTTTSKVSTAASSKPQTRRMLKTRQDQSSLKVIVENLVESSKRSHAASVSTAASTSSTATSSTTASSKSHTRRMSMKTWAIFPRNGSVIAILRPLLGHIGCSA